MSFGVIGAGVVGLSTALELQKQYPNARIRIFADKFGVNTTTDVSAGIFRPSPSFSGPNEIITKKWIDDSYNYWDDLRQREDAALYGVTQLSVYSFSSTDPSIVRNHLLEGLLPLYRQCTDQELKICPGDWKYGSFYTTILTDTQLWQDWAQRRFVENGGRVIEKHILKLSDFKAQDYDAIINCTGFGARKLCNDVKVVPIRGQIMKVHAPWVKTAFYADYDTFVVPGFDGAVTLGGTRQYESYNLQVDKYDSISIRERCKSLLPSLADATCLHEAVGLSPYRGSVRVEGEMITDSQGNLLKVIHNYGHGGYGVTVGPGTAKYVANLLKMFHSRNKL